jgi:hypothetical protein
VTGETGTIYCSFYPATASVGLLKKSLVRKIMPQGSTGFTEQKETHILHTLALSPTVYTT